MEHKRLWVDMDGTLAVFQPVRTLETLYEQGYFLNLQPIKNVLEAVKIVLHERPEIEVAILSSVLSDSKYARREKNEWLDRNLPEVTKRYFPSCGSDKKDIIPGGVTDRDYLLDDYTKNLVSWEPPAKGVKLLNGINHTNETWKGNRISITRSPKALAESILAAMDGKSIQDTKPISAKAIKCSSMKPMNLEP